MRFSLLVSLRIPHRLRKMREQRAQTINVSSPPAARPRRTIPNGFEPLCAANFNFIFICIFSSLSDNYILLFDLFLYLYISVNTYFFHCIYIHEKKVSEIRSREGQVPWDIHCYFVEGRDNLRGPSSRRSALQEPPRDKVRKGVEALRKVS